MANNPPEIRKLVCRGCNREIDEVGCISRCKYDNGQRPPESMEYDVYVYMRTEPYAVPKSKKRKPL